VAVKESSSSLDTQFAIISKWFSIKISDIFWRIQAHTKLLYSCIKILVNSKCDKDGEDKYVYTEF
jgi:DNA-binding XRE family transcriptional regulator